MRRRVHSLSFRACLAALALLFAAAAAAFHHVRLIAATSPNCCATVSSWSSSGGGAALGHYEDAIRQYPNAALQQRFTPRGSITTWNAATPTGFPRVGSAAVDGAGGGLYSGCC